MKKSSYKYMFIIGAMLFAPNRSFAQSNDFQTKYEAFK